MTDPSYVVTGGSQGVGRAVVQRLTREGHVVVLDLTGDLSWAPETVECVHGDARDQVTAERAAAAAAASGRLSGWVNNAAMFGDATLATASAEDILGLITANLALAVTGCHVAINHFRASRQPGAIVNVSSHQAQRAVRGALPYATAKAAVEGLTRAVAVDHGPAGIRFNAVALGSIRTERYERFRTHHPEVDEQMADLHPLGRVGTGQEVADVIAFLLSPQASFINGAVVPVDGGRAAQGADPEASRPVDSEIP
jgi:NAD(P)-dependent dehydrogenase (short-subunit alcohol dehydrogenase family)